MLIHLARLGDEILDQPVSAFTTHASTDMVGRHRLTDSPQEADVILFTQCHMLLGDWRLERIRRHPLRLRFPGKVLVYNEQDRPWCAFPGVYVNMPGAQLRPEFQRPWGYFVPDQRPAVPEGPAAPPRDLLFSFIGTATTAIRRPLLALRHPEAVVEEVKGFRFWDPGSERFAQRRQRFRTILGRSQFVLCPRGWGTSSVRLYETLSAGAVPVIIADDWVAPAGIDWERFSIRWPEGRTGGLVSMLEQRRAEADRMGREARLAYQAHFSPGSYFSGVADLCAGLLPTAVNFPAAGVRDRLWAQRGAEHAAARVKYVQAALAARLRRPCAVR